MYLDFFNLTEKYLSKNIYYFNLLAYSLLAFLVPFFMGHPQIFVGVIVNTALFLTALNLKFKESLGVIVLPSIAVLARGMIFGALTKYLLLLIPFIWIGNLILVYLMKYFYLKNKNNFFSSIIFCSVIKSSFLFIITSIFYFFNMLPIQFLMVMGLLQLITAFSGGLVASVAQKSMSRIL